MNNRRYNSERRAFRGRSYKRGGKRVRQLRDAVNVRSDQK